MTLEQSTNPAVSNILTAFEQLTGRGVLVNTSLNVHGEPIIHEPSRALEMVPAGRDHAPDLG
jgi:carbamoyltransferase